VALLAALCVAVASGGVIRTREIQGRIVGGTPVDDGNKEYDFMVSLQANGFGHYCGGSLISPTVVLTAAHCQDGYPDPDSVLIGAHRLSKPGEGKKIGVKKVIIHPKYGSSNGVFDIALIILDKKVTGINPVRLSSPSNGGMFEKAGVMSKVIGWGALKEGGDGPDRLQQVQVPIVSYADCTAKGAYSKNDVSQTANVCAGFKAGGKDSCQGDSGGPLFVESLENNPLTQIGVVSWGEGCARKNKYGVYAKVASSFEWIKSNTPDFASPSPAPSPVVSPVPSPVVGPPTTEEPDWELYDRQMKFCNSKGKNVKKCKKLNACVFKQKQCVTKLVNNPLYANPPSGPPPEEAKPDWEKYSKEMKFCKRFSKNVKGCRKQKKRCSFDKSNTHRQKCVSNLVNNPLYQTASPTRSPTPAPTPPDEYSGSDYSDYSEYEYSEELDPCWDLNKKQCNQNNKCKWHNFYKYCVLK
jgi:hypothetical protein